jgi:hypothetical protein
VEEVLEVGGAEAEAPEQRGGAERAVLIGGGTGDEKGWGAGDEGAGVLEGELRVVRGVRAGEAEAVLQEIRGLAA